MPTIANLVVDVNANTSGLQKGLKVASAGLLALGAGAVVAVDKASDLNESMSKAQVVFGKSADSVLKWSESSAQGMGLSQQAALEATGTFGNLFTAMDIGTKPAAEMSTQLAQLAGDLASFNNADPKEVLENLRSGLVGEAEPLRKFGVQLSAARIESEALALGLGKQGQELSAAAKAQAAYSIILDDTATAQGDFARTSDGVANQQRILRAEFDNLMARVGGFLIPVAKELLETFLALADVIGRNVGPVARELVGWLQNIWKKVQPVVTVIGEHLMEALTQTWNVIVTNLGPALQDLFKALQPVFKIVLAVAGVAFAALLEALPVVIRLLAGVVSVLAKVWGAIGVLIGWIGKAVVWIRDKFVAAWVKLKEVAIAIWNPIKSAALGIFSAIRSAFASVINFIIDKLNVVIHALNLVKPGDDFPSIPRLDMGGAVTRTGLAVVHRGELVVPAAEASRTSGPARSQRTTPRLHVDRRRFAGALAYDTTFRGW